jgi:hypothetical protein
MALYKLPLFVVDLSTPLLELLTHVLHTLPQGGPLVRDLVLLRVLPQLPGDLHAAKFGSTHTAKVRYLQPICPLISASQMIYFEPGCEGLKLNPNPLERGQRAYSLRSPGYLHAAKSGSTNTAKVRYLQPISRTDFGDIG